MLCSQACLAGRPVGELGVLGEEQGDAAGAELQHVGGTEGLRLVVAQHQGDVLDGGVHAQPRGAERHRVLHARQRQAGVRVPYLVSVNHRVGLRRPGRSSWSHSQVWLHSALEQPQQPDAALACAVPCLCAGQLRTTRQPGTAGHSTAAGSLLAMGPGRPAARPGPDTCAPLSAPGATGSPSALPAWGTSAMSVAIHMAACGAPHPVSHGWGSCLQQGRTRTHNWHTPVCHTTHSRPRLPAQCTPFQS